MLVGFAAGVVYVAADRDARRSRLAPIGDALVILVIGPMSGVTVADALFLLTHGFRPRE
jgi:hypothetical protein